MESPDSKQSATDQTIDRAFAMHQSGQLTEAEIIYQKLLLDNPNHPRLLHLLGVLLGQKGQRDLAISFLRRAVTLDPTAIQYQSNLGAAYVAAGQFNEAIRVYQDILKLRPDDYKIMESLAYALIQAGRADEATDAYRAAIQLQPQSATAWHQLGQALRKQKKFEEALNAFQQALKLDKTIGQRDPLFFNDLGVIHHQLGQFKAATQSFARAAALENPPPLARFNLGMLQLLQGDFKNGWEGYERRFEARSVPIPARYKQRGTWDGSDLRNRTILLDCEQGLGDAIQFARFIPVLAQLGGKPILLTQPELRHLMKSVEGIADVICPTDPLPIFDVQCPLLSLGRILNITLETIPGKVPYLLPDPAAAKSWNQRIPQNARKKIGLCWAGGPSHPEDSIRSLSAKDLSPLKNISDAWFCSLQKSLQNNSPDFELTDWTSELTDFADTTALIANLDLVITCDTAVAHLAGALGKPVWLMLRFAPDWRWLLHRDDSPWYPTMRLFRQTTPGDWTSVVQRIVDFAHHSLHI